MGFGIVYNYSIDLMKSDKLDIGIDLGSWRGVPPLAPKNFRYLFKIPGGGFKSRLNLSYSHRIGKRVNLKLGGYYITSLSSHLGDNYFPYAYGIYVGVQYRLVKLFNRKGKKKESVD